jgi:hypothetical protein
LTFSPLYPSLSLEEKSSLHADNIWQLLLLWNATRILYLLSSSSPDLMITTG